MSKGTLRELFEQKQAEKKVARFEEIKAKFGDKIEPCLSKLEQEASLIEENIKAAILKGETQYMAPLGAYDSITIGSPREVFGATAAFKRIQRVCEDNGMTVEIVGGRTRPGRRTGTRMANIGLHVAF